MKTSIFVIIFSMFAVVASAQNANIKRIGTTTFSVGTYDHPFRFEKIVHSGDAADLYWDWAACIMMVLNYQGLNVSQEQIMMLVNGDIAQPLSTPQDLMFAINKTTPRDWSTSSSKIFCEVATLDADVVFDELSAGRPIIMGTRNATVEGRAYVVSAMAYTIKFDVNGQQTGITPQTVTIRDPWPSGLSNRTIEWVDFVSLTASLYTVKVAFK